ncbi:cytochrome b/b6 domain-containing protein [Acinetobacter sp. ME22]|uniref:cytochrome b/b6 domain-containing protein n=1 Tax=Acinetobacter sp. ME22 TaxID=2904802 RepID=UPI001EDBB909|nr:cytochrome b/b6 domain-containing protein [Acinetobacter sp. ME22]MCG2574595.1 cytochrome b/b6 domain-containing protein [Acinetobacter sp. ME22]
MNKVIPASHIDSVIRLLHLIILVSFTGAYFTGDNFDLHQLHMLFGYLLVIALGLRIVWQLLAAKMKVSRPFGWIKRQQMSFNFLKLGKQQTLGSQKSLQYWSSALLHLSIFLMVLFLPMTVILGYITETTGQHNIKEIHDLFANLFLGVVIAHLAAIVLNSLAIRQMIFLRMFWISEGIQAKVLFSLAIIIGIMVSFGLWFMLT